MELNKRCSRCILPSTFPNIGFNNQGVCNYCRSYTSPPAPFGEDKLNKVIKENTHGAISCIIPLSGGKDSSYVLYYATKVLGLKVIALNYDSGFQSELAIENIKRACRILNVPLLIYKGDFKSKLTMLKQSISIANIVGVPFGVCRNCENSIRAISAQVANNNNVKIILYGDSTVESTQSQSFWGFRGLIRRTRIYKIPKLAKVVTKFEAIGARQRAKLGLPLRNIFNPSATITFPFLDIQLVHFFDYIMWASLDKEELLSKEVGWEHPEETISRFDCLLHPLDNYKWFQETGITKDGYTFANMIRAGAITREKASLLENDLLEQLHHDCVEFIKQYDVGPDDWICSKK